MSDRKSIEERLARWILDPQSGRLPPLRELARSWEASTSTLQAALAKFRRSGEIESRPGAGIWVAGRRPTVPVVARMDAEEFARLLLQEIRRGLRPWNRALPSAKEFARLHSCHPQTVSKGLRLLESQGHLRREGRHHFPTRPPGRSRSSTPTILCVGARRDDGTLRMDGDRELDFWRELGNATAEAGIRLARAPWDGSRIEVGADVLGVVAATWHLPEPEELYRALERLRKPACVWVEDLGFHPAVAREHRRLRFHDQGYGLDAGAALAKHLLGLGHRKLAWLSPWHSSAWSRKRLEGVESAAADSGARVESFVLPGRTEWDRLGEAWASDKIWQDFPAPDLERVVEGSSASLRRQAIHELGWNRIRADFEPLVEQAARSGATAWICANDPAALLALDGCRARGLRIPTDVSLCGFDDTAEALRSDLTSYRFATAPMVRAMVRQILSDRPEPGLVRHAGLVVARGSTARR
jgi:DNA-binding transcriptional regulator YhcF (GntR family)